MISFYRHFLLALEQPENSDEILKNNRILQSFIILIGLFCWIVWFEAGFDTNRPFCGNFSPIISENQIDIITTGNVLYSLFITIFAISYILLNALILNIRIKTKSKKKRKIKFNSILVILLIKTPFILSYTSIPLLLIHEKPFSSYNNFIFSLIWAVGGLVAIVNVWISLGTIASKNYLSFKSGFYISLLFTILFAFGFYSFLYNVKI